jgi:hypothetical protein
MSIIDVKNQLPPAAILFANPKNLREQKVIPQSVSFEPSQPLNQRDFGA